MYLTTRNVNTAFREIVGLFNREQNRNSIIGHRPSRNGNVLMIDEPVTVTYTHPRERVLFNAARDANPFFHLYESLWMLAGRNDVAPLAYYASRMRGFSDDGGTLNGAYGYRWRHSYTRPKGIVSSWSNDEQRDVHYHHEDAGEVDQLDILVDHLKADPASRRAVLQMWNVEDDLLKIGLHPERSGNFYNPDLKLPASKDVCCNLSVMFSLREIDPLETKWGSRVRHELDITVTNRSNDLIWGCLGADFVDFSILQEYMAARIGVEVGKYHHFTNNLHVYDWNWKPDEWLKDDQRDWYNDSLFPKEWKQGTIVPLVNDPVAFERELSGFVDNMHTEIEGPDIDSNWTEPFLVDVAAPMFRAFYMYKNKDHGAALYWAERIKADDWHLAATGWLKRRIK